MLFGNLDNMLTMSPWNVFVFDYKIMNELLNIVLVCVCGKYAYLIAYFWDEFKYLQILESQQHKMFLIVFLIKYV